jgi:hypothetical protein
MQNVNCIYLYIRSSADTQYNHGWWGYHNSDYWNNNKKARFDEAVAK